MFKYDYITPYSHKKGDVFWNNFRIMYVTLYGSF